MNEIKCIGGYCRTNEKDEIVNDSSIMNIQPVFHDLIKATKDLYQRHLGSTIHSIYIRGSLPKGKGIEKVSDLDTICIVHEDPKKVDRLSLDAGIKLLLQNQQPVSDIEISIHHLRDILNNTYFDIIPFMLRTHSVCIAGDSLIPKLPVYKADESLANHHLFAISSQISQALMDLEDNNDEEDMEDCWRWISKHIIRAGMALTLTSRGIYTRDLYPAYQLFRSLYPHKDGAMYAVLNMAINPEKNAGKREEFLKGFGGWIIQEAEAWLDRYNPGRIAELPLR